MHPFVHLHVHSQYSILDGQASIQALVDKAMHDGMRGIAITDHGNMFGIKEFYNYVNKKNGPIFNEIKDLKKKIVAIEKGETECENKETIIVRILQIEAAVVNIKGIIDVADTKINGKAENLQITDGTVPIKGDITCI